MVSCSILPRLIAVVLTTLLALALGTAPASAHTDLEKTSPADGAELASTPAAVTLTFSDPVNAMETRISVTGPKGEVQQGPPKLADDTVTQPLQPGAPAGKYTVSWRTTAVDGDPISGSFTFSSDVAAESSATPSAPGTGQSSTDTPSPPSRVPSASPVPKPTPTPPTASTGTSPTPTPAVPATGQSSPLSGIPGWASILIGLAAVAIGVKIARDARGRDGSAGTS